MVSLPFESSLFFFPDPVGLIADWLVSFVNSNVHANEASPVFALSEIEVIRALADIVGYGPESDGIFCSGSSHSNMLAMYLALKHLYPEALSDGLWRKDRMVIFTSEQSDFSTDRPHLFLAWGQNRSARLNATGMDACYPMIWNDRLKLPKIRGKSPFLST